MMPYSGRAQGAKGEKRSAHVTLKHSPALRSPRMSRANRQRSLAEVERRMAEADIRLAHAEACLG
jgi:hypothetical protein